MCVTKKIRLTVSPETATFDLNPEGDGYADVVLTVAANEGSITVTDVYNGEDKLTKDTNYTVADNKVTLKTAYLATLTEDEEYSIIIETNQGDVVAAVTVVDTTTEEG
ncbi:MAG: hypothetical protein GX992_07540 [Clostridium sp.]|nr:hypothetical protein [Clostridium sp.]